MKQPNPDYKEKLKELINDSPFFSHISLKMVDVGIGFSVFEMEAAHQHLHPFGFVHGGVVASIIDSAAFWAMHFDLDDPNTDMTSVDLKLNFLAPVTPGKLIAKGRRIKLGKTLGYAEAEIKDENGRLLSHGTSTLMVLNGRGLTGDPSLPEKYIM